MLSASFNVLTYSSSVPESSPTILGEGTGENPGGTEAFFVETNLEDVNGIELCTLQPPLIDQNSVLRRSFELITLLCSQPSSKLPIVTLKWDFMAQCRLSRKCCYFSRVSSDKVIDEREAALPQESSNVSHSSLGKTSDPKPIPDPFLCILHSSSYRRLCPLMVNMILETIMAHLRWVLLCVETHVSSYFGAKRAQNEAPAETHQPGCPYSVAHSEATELSICTCFSFLLLSEEVREALQSSGISTGHLTAAWCASIERDCLWKRELPRGGPISEHAGHQKEELWRGKLQLERVRWTTSLVQSLADLAECWLAQDDSLSSRTHCTSFHPPSVVCTLRGYTLLNDELKKPVTEKTDGLSPALSSQCFDFMRLQVSSLFVQRPHSLCSRRTSVFERQTAQLVQHLMDYYLKPSERYRDDGTDAFKEALSLKTKGESSAMLPGLEAALDYFERGLAKAQNGLALPIRSTILQETAPVSWEAQECAVNFEEPSAYRMAVQYSRYFAVKKQRLDEAIDAVMAMQQTEILRASPTVNDRVECAEKKSYTSLESSIEPFFKRIQAPFMLTGASFPEYWESLLWCTLENEEETDGKTFACSSSSVVHDALTRYEAVRPAVAALSWRAFGPGACGCVLARKEQAISQSFRFWRRLIPSPTALQLLVYSLVRLMVIGTANMSQVCIEIARIAPDWKSAETRESVASPASTRGIKSLAATLAQGCEKAWRLLREHLLESHRRPEIELHRLFGKPLSPLHLRLILDENPLPHCAKDGVEHNDVIPHCNACLKEQENLGKSLSSGSKAYDELLWCFQMQFKLLLRSRSLWAIAGEIEKAKKVKDQLYHTSLPLWENIREAYSCGQCDWNGTAAYVKAESQALVLADWLVVRLRQEDWEGLVKQIRAYE